MSTQLAHPIEANTRRANLSRKAFAPHSPPSTGTVAGELRPPRRRARANFRLNELVVRSGCVRHFLSPQGAGARPDFWLNPKSNLERAHQKPIPALRTRTKLPELNAT